MAYGVPPHARSVSSRGAITPLRSLISSIAASTASSTASAPSLALCFALSLAVIGGGCSAGIRKQLVDQGQRFRGDAGGYSVRVGQDLGLPAHN